MSELFWWQAAAVFWGAVCFFRQGAQANGLEMTPAAWAEVVQAALIVVLVFALLTEGRGCSSLGGQVIDMPM